MLAVGGHGGRVKLVDEATGNVRWSVQAHAEQPYSFYARVAMSPDGRFVASVDDSEDNWKLWDAARGVVCMAGARHDGTGSCSCRMNRIGHRTSLDARCPVQAHTARLRAVAFSPCGQRLATGGNDSTVILWDAQTGRAEQVMQGEFETACSLSFSSDGARLASGSWDGSIRVWDATTGALLRTMTQAYKGYSTKVFFSPTNSHKLASTTGNTLVSLWDVDSGEMIRSFEGRRFAVFSPEGRTIATAGSHGAQDVHLVDVETGALRLSMVDPQHKFFSVSFSPDGSKLASSSWDGCKVWDASTGALLRTIEPSTIGGWINSVAWGRDWVLDTQLAMAFAMGQHPRLGERSRVPALEPGVVRMILDRV